MDEWQAMWTALQQAVWIGYGPIIIWILSLALAAVILLSAFELGVALYRKYIG